MVRPSGVDQALGAGGRCQRQGELLASGERWECSLLRRLVLQAQHLRGQLMQSENPPDAAMISGALVAGLDDPRECTGGARVGEGEADDLVLDMERHAHFGRGLPARLRTGSPVQEPHQAGALKTPQIPPAAMRREARRVALLRQRTLALEERAQYVIPC
jgi:hypothetical protein